MRAVFFLAVAFFANAAAYTFRYNFKNTGKFNSFNILDQPSYINLKSTSGTLPAASSVYGKADSPRNVSAVVTTSGITVSWVPALTSSPIVTSYIVTGGPGSCPVVVDAPSDGASEFSLTMPVIRGQTAVTVSVQAVNAYGYSSPVKATRILDLGMVTSFPPVKSLEILHFSDFHGAIGKQILKYID